MTDTNEQQPAETSKFARIMGFIALILFIAAVFLGFLSLRNEVVQLKARVESLESKLGDGQ